MNDLQQKLISLREKIEGKINHPFLSQKIDVPLIDDDKLLLLTSFLNDMKVPCTKIDDYVIPTLLLDIALETHDKVTNEMAGKVNFRNRQLTVLAGTYYSGLYYKWLASKGDLPIIRLLAKGVETINDLKITVYRKEADTIDQLMDYIERIEATLFANLVDHFHSPKWKQLISNFLFFKRLYSEKEQFIQGKNSLIFESMKKIAFPNHDSLNDLTTEQSKYLITICDRYLDFAKDQIMDTKEKILLPNRAIRDRIEYVLFETELSTRSLVEEG